MKTNTEVFIHSPGRHEPAVLQIGDESTIAQLIAASGAAEGANVFVEDNDEPLSPSKSVRECGIKHRGHVQITRCRHIAVSVIYNGKEEKKVFSPARRVKHVLKWAIDQFGLKGVDAQNKVLRLKNPPETELLPDAQIGSYADPEKCQLDLCLVPPIRFQGAAYGA